MFGGLLSFTLLLFMRQVTDLIGMVNRSSYTLVIGGGASGNAIEFHPSVLDSSLRGALAQISWLFFYFRCASGIFLSILYSYRFSTII